MKGVRYLVDEKGTKTHVVLDLDVWSETWQQFFQDDEATLLERSADDLQAELDTLEKDLPPSDVDKWLAAFDNA